MTDTKEFETATLGGGCFWCLEAVFVQLRGVESVESGYAGGTVIDPSYRHVCQGDTGHAEVVRLRFDPAQLTYRDVLDVFFTIHDPTTRDRQGNDVGSQYRSVIYHHTPQQRDAALQSIAEWNARGVWNAPIVTEVMPAPVFYAAEDYHQDYFANNPRQPYCQAIVAPKVAKFRKAFFDRLKR